MACPCCSPCCTCEQHALGLFSFYVNGKALRLGPDYNANANDFIPGLSLLPGFSIVNQLAGWAVSSCADGKITAAIRIQRWGSIYLEEYMLNGALVEVRYYEFDLSGGGCGIITGEPVPPPEDVDLASLGIAGAVIDGDVIRYWEQQNDGADNTRGGDWSLFHVGWDSLAVQASCQVRCSGYTQQQYVNWFGEPYSLEACCDALATAISGGPDQTGCECQPLPCTVNNPDVCPDGVSTDGVTTLGCHMIVNPLP